MRYKIDFINSPDDWFVKEYFGDAPVKYECTAQYCWRDCVPCNHCEASRVVIPDKQKFDEWKAKDESKKIYPCSKEHTDFFKHARLHIRNIDHNHIIIKDGVAYPVELSLFAGQKEYHAYDTH